MQTCYCSRPHWRFIREDTNVHNQLIIKITEYLVAGGLFNPEYMEHEKVRDLLMDIRTYLNDFVPETK